MENFSFFLGMAGEIIKYLNLSDSLQKLHVWVSGNVPFEPADCCQYVASFITFH